MTERDLGSTWYAVSDPQQDPAHVIGGPFDTSLDARRCASFSPGRVVARNAVYLVNDIKNNGYSVEWADGVQPPETLVESDGGHDLDEQAAYVAAELSIPEREARRFLENQRAADEGGPADE